MNGLCFILNPLRRASAGNNGLRKVSKLQRKLSGAFQSRNILRTICTIQTAIRQNRYDNGQQTQTLSSSFSSSPFPTATTTPAVEFSNLVEMQTKVCQLFSDRPALGTFRGGKYEWMSYSDLEREVSALRIILYRRFGICGQDKVAIISNNRVEWAVAFFAVNSLGAQLVPMYVVPPINLSSSLSSDLLSLWWRRWRRYEAQSSQDWEFIIRDSESKLLIVANETIRERTQSYLGQVVLLHPYLFLNASCLFLTSYKPENVCRLGSCETRSCWTANPIVRTRIKGNR